MLSDNASRSRFRHLVSAMAQLAFLAIMAAFGPSSALADHLTPVTLQLKWQHQFQFAGYYAAQEKGFYREAGLDVRLVEGTPTTNVVDEVLSGRANHGVGNSSLLLDRHLGKPVVALAVIFQHSPLMLYAHVYSGISSVHDLKGKRVMLEPHSEELLAYLRRENVSVDTIRWDTHSFSPDDLILGRVDAMSGYSTTEPFYLDKSYTPYIALSPRSAGIDFYGDNLFTSETEIRKNPARVKAFREASLKGWEYALEHPEEIASLIREKYHSPHSREFLLFEAGRMRPLISHDLIPMGYMHTDRWRQIIKTYAELGLLAKDFSLEGFLYIDNAKEEMNGERRRWLIGLGIAAAVSALALLIAMSMVRLNRRLKREMTAREEAMAALRESESKFRFLAENTGDVIWILDIASGRFTYVSPTVFELRGYTAEEVMAEPMSAAVTPESAERAMAALADTIARWNAGDRGNTLVVTEIDQPHKDGHIIHTEVVSTLHADATGKPAYVIGVTRNITQRKRAEEAIRQLAFYDPLTRLPNRRLLLDRIPQQIARAKRDHYRVALLFIDLDQFKPINDQFGHDTGDWLLKSVAERLHGSLRQSDTCARIGGDEFVALLPDVHEIGHALQVAEKICGELQLPFITAEGTTLQISSSIGVALYPDHSDNEQDLLRQADEAMYRAKKAGRNRVVLYSPAPLAAENETLDSGAFGDDRHHIIHLRWKHGFNCGQLLIDQQHRELFRLSNALLDATLTRAEHPEAFDHAFDALLGHVIKHFADEEEILRDAHYDGLEHHVREHQKLVKEAIALRRRYEQAHVPIGELIEFLVNTVVAKHMLHEDRLFFPLFARDEEKSTAPS
ncbi:diguanylate cyclase domain-containing protein [Propionivibrio limicola]|uniref:diguanylate cyclase domain-containing protein n=1 Tax=Propionivibrio limicola TaxID=167645 RepID=UPI0012909EA0|nr:diguanylate cyclase [Propionivibrio limicola]